MISPDRIKAAHDAVASLYAEARDEASSLEHLDRLCVHPAPTSRVLDLCCGADLPSGRRLAEAGRRVIGLDIFSTMPALARADVSSA